MLPAFRTLKDHRDYQNILFPLLAEAGAALLCCSRTERSRKLYFRLQTESSFPCSKVHLNLSREASIFPLLPISDRRFLKKKSRPTLLRRQTNFAPNSPG